jgi:hypothetical protein
VGFGLRREVFLVPEAPELAKRTAAAVVVKSDGGDDDPLPRCSCWSLLPRRRSQREVRKRGPRDSLEEALEQIHRRDSTGARVGAGAAVAAGAAALAPCWCWAAEDTHWTICYSSAHGP